jgi:hypothetical protein
MGCLDDFMAAFNARDIKAFEATFNFPSVRLASNTLAIIEPGYHQPGMFGQGALAAWDHSAWERREVIHAGEDKVHVNTRFTRYRADGSVIGGFDSIYVVHLRDRPLGGEGTLQLRALSRVRAATRGDSSWPCPPPHAIEALPRVQRRGFSI